MQAYWNLNVLNIKASSKKRMSLQTNVALIKFATFNTARCISTNAM